MVKVDFNVTRVTDENRVKRIKVTCRSHGMRMFLRVDIGLFA